MTVEDNPRFATRARIEALLGQWAAEQAEAEAAATVELRAGAGAGDQAQLQHAADLTRASLTSLQETLKQQLDDEPPLFDTANNDPIALLPVRVETIWWTASGEVPDSAQVAAGNANPPTLRVRVYPDDLHLSHFDPPLTRSEHAAGQAYWQNPEPVAWQRLLELVRPQRATWVAHATRPGAPTPAIREEDAAPPLQTVTMPDRWRCIGFVDGNVVADRTGEPIPNPLPIDILHNEDSWTVTWFEAVVAGMAIELELAPGVDHLDELVVVGVSDQAADTGAQQLRDLFHGHALSTGLAILAAGSPTNNTPRTKSAFSPESPLPVTADPRPPAPPQVTALASALGLPDLDFLGTASGATDPEPAAVAALTLLTWPAIGGSFATSVFTHVDGTDGHPRPGSSASLRGVRDHLLGHVRSRGPLPTIRVGRQPYGVLPTSSLSDWKPEHSEEPDAVLLPWLVQLREKWRVLIDAIPEIGMAERGTSTDELMVGILERQPAATGLAMTRMNGPAATVPRTRPGTEPSNLRIAGVAADSALRWTTSSDAWTDLGWLDPRAVDTPDFVARMTAGHEVFTESVANTADYIRTVRTFLAGEISAGDYHARWPVLRVDGVDPQRRRTLTDLPPDSSTVLDALVCTVNWFSVDDEEDPLRTAFMVTGEVDQAVSTILDNDEFGADTVATDPRVRGDTRERISTAARSAQVLTDIEAGMLALAAIPLRRIPELLMEVVDVYSHRLDAWVTSLATSRLDRLRANGSAGIRVGGYGWVQNLRPMQERTLGQLHDGTPTIISSQDGYIHAPSLQQATTAAVLRSGSLSHPDTDTYAVKLNSRRSRVARWLVEGVRQGQNLGALLGYRFERALHDAGLDTELKAFRKHFGAPVVAETDGAAAGDGWERSTEAIAARNVVDGVKLVRAVDPWTLAGEQDPIEQDRVNKQDRVKRIIEDVADALDAVGDLLLAESVHQLTIGNTARAGLAADSLGRGSEVPDRFYALTTPHRARSLTHRLAALLPAAPTATTGWPTDPLATLLPEVERWVAHLLGPAAEWTLHTEDGAAECPLDQLQIGALTMALDVSSAEPAALQQQFRDRVPGAADRAVQFGGPAWAALRGMSSRIRSLLSNAEPLLPEHLPGSASLDVSGVRRQLIAFADTAAVRAHPRGADLAIAASAAADDPRVWLGTARGALGDVLGAEVPLLPTVSGPAPTAHPGVGTADTDTWLLRHTEVRGVARTLYDTLLLSGLRSRRCETFRAAQNPVEAGEAWIGGGFDADSRPQATTHLVWHQPMGIPAALTGLVFDEWVELLPGADHIRRLPAGVAPLTSPPESELTGVAFHYDRPDAKAPHALLIAVPPNLDRGWTPDTLVQVLRETVEWGKLRAIDAQDFPLLRDLLPATRIAPGSAAGNFLATIENQGHDPDPNGPFRLNPNHRSSGRVDDGLTARIHDPLWLLTRQWQFGEFLAQDAASPALATLRGFSAGIDAWRPVAPPGTSPGDWVPYDPRTTPLDVVIEAESAPDEPTVRARAEGGAHFRVMLDAAGLLDSPATQALANIRTDTADTSTVGLLESIGGRLPDAESIALRITSGTLPPEFAGVARDWAQWWDDRQAGHGSDCLDEHRFEYAVELSAGGAVLRSAEYLGDGFDWYSVDVDSSADDQSAPAGAPYRFADVSLPSVVRYSGLPADRFWEMEDARIDVGATDISTLDTGRLLLISFATVYGNDWFLTPLEVPAGSLTTIEQMLVLDVFDRTHVIKRAGADEPSWSMYTLESDDPDHWAAQGLLMVARTQGHRGEPLEQLRLVRDELANLAWAVQRRVTDTNGEPVDCRDRWLRSHPPGAEADRHMPVYRVQTTVPDYWFPLVPVAEGPGVIHFARADINAPDAQAAPTGRLVTPDLWLHEEEVPREGASVLRRPLLGRWFDGSWHSWIRREKSAGAGEASSGLQFDSVTPTDPWP